MRKYQIWREARLQFLEKLLDVVSDVRKKAIPEGLDLDLVFGALEKRRRTGSRLGSALLIPAEHDPVHSHLLVFSDDLQHCPATADFQVIGVGAETQKAKRQLCGPSERKI